MPLPDSPPQPASARAQSAKSARKPARRAAKAHAPQHHEKRPHQVAHLPVNPAPASAHERTAEHNPMTRALVARQRAKMRRFVARVLGVAAILFVVQCAVAALTAPQFAIKRVEVRGLQSTPAQAVEQLAAPLEGQNIFRARGAALAQKVQALPTVATARIVRPLHWPPQLRLEVTEREPLVRVGAGQSWWVADAQGVPFRRANAGDAALYALTAPQFAPQTGKPLPSPQWARARDLVLALEADNALAAPTQGASKAPGASRAPRFWQLRRLYLDRDGFAAVRVSGDRNSGASLAAQRELLIRLGEEDWPAKLAQARTALAYFARTGQRARELDLVSGEHPRWRPLEQVAQNKDLADGSNGLG